MSPLKTLLYKILHFINEIIPKKNIVLFTSFPQYSDNSWALYEYIIASRKDIVDRYDLVWGQECGNGKVRFVKKKSLVGYWTFLRSRYIISTHGYFSGLKSGRDQKQINLWHGNGYKRTPVEERGFHGDINIITSDIFIEDALEKFATTVKNIEITGYPRNDYLFHKTNHLSKLGIKKSEHKKVLMWLPTFRKSLTGGSHCEGREDSFGIGSMVDDDFRAINEVLKSNNYLLLIKPHPLDSVTLNGRGPWTNIAILTQGKLSEMDVNLYELLGEVDVLLSDYSSVVIDYSLLDKPITMVLSDMKEYKENRGFVFDDVTEWFPGPIISDTSSLIAYMSDMEKINEQWTEKRRQLAKKFNKYSDSNSCERVCNLIFGEKR